MKQFIARHEAKIEGVLSGFDRVLFRGYLPIMSGWAMASFLQDKDLRFRQVKDFLVDSATQVVAHAKAMAAQAGRPYQYLGGKIRMEDSARRMAEEAGIEQGLVCVYSVLQPCRTFSFRFRNGRPFVASARRKCLHLYYYFMDRDLGLIHVKLQTWFPMPIQVYVNGQEWLSRKLQRAGVRYTKVDNVFVRIEDGARANRMAERFAGLAWEKILEKYAMRVNPLMRGLLTSMSYYW